MSDETRREDAEGDDRTRREDDGSTQREGAAEQDGFHLVNLPPSLAARFTVDAEATQAIETEGGQALLVVARDRATSKRVVIKIYRRGTSLDERAMDQLGEMGRDKEGQKHVVPIYEYGTEKGLLWEIQEFLPQGSLEAILSTGTRVEPNLARELVAELANALNYLHARGVTHRDLKPANILLRSTSPLDVVLGDFGLATQTVLSEAVRSVAGSWPYLPPESRGNVVSPAMDWWAMGVIVARAITGRHLFQEPNGFRLLPDQVITNQLYERTYEIPETGDVHWDLLLRGLLTHDRHHRWSGVEVAEWLAGGNPDVYIEPADAAVGPSLKPFAFANREYSAPTELAAALREHWKQAGELLVGRGADDLRVWLRRTSVASAAESVLDGRISNPESPLVRLQLIMDPSSAPFFRDRELSAAGLSAAISDAREGRESVIAWITALRRERILFAWGSEAEVPSEVRHADDLLGSWWSIVDNCMSTVPANQRSNVLGALEPMLLAAALDTGERERLRKAARAVIDANQVLPAWAARIKDGASASNGTPAEWTLAVLTLPAAGKAEVARLEAEQEAARQRQREAVELASRQKRLDELGREIQVVSRRADSSGFLWLLVVPVGWPGVMSVAFLGIHGASSPGIAAVSGVLAVIALVFIGARAVRRASARTRLAALRAEQARLR